MDDQIKMAVDYFIVKCNKRRRVMVEQTEKELNGEMVNCELEDWEQQYLDYVNSN